ncbi:MAG: hypothetical protein AAGB29_12325 [Planctomycetota bacterium]
MVDPYTVSQLLLALPGAIEATRSLCDAAIKRRLNVAEAERAQSLLEQIKLIHDVIRWIRVSDAADEWFETAEVPLMDLVNHFDNYLVDGQKLSFQDVWLMADDAMAQLLGKLEYFSLPQIHLSGDYTVTLEDAEWRRDVVRVQEELSRLIGAALSGPSDQQLLLRESLTRLKRSVTTMRNAIKSARSKYYNAIEDSLAKVR